MASQRSRRAGPPRDRRLRRRVDRAGRRRGAGRAPHGGRRSRSVRPTRACRPRATPAWAAPRPRAADRARRRRPPHPRSRCATLKEELARGPPRLRLRDHALLRRPGRGSFAMPGYDPYRLLYRHMIGSTALMRREVLRGDRWLRHRVPRLRGLGVLAATRSSTAMRAAACRGRRRSSTAAMARTMVSGARREYRALWYRKLRRKHAGPVPRRRAGSPARSDIGPAGPGAVPLLLGPRPVPARLRSCSPYSLLWRPTRRDVRAGHDPPLGRDRHPRERGRDGRRAARTVQQLGTGDELVIVDNGSSDGTPEPRPRARPPASCCSSTAATPASLPALMRGAAPAATFSCSSTLTRRRRRAS